MANTFLATAAFGLEGVVAGELKRMGLPAKAENGGARFEGTLMDAFRANLHLRTADRVLLVLAEREAVTFEDLFQLVGSVAWERLLTRDAAIHVSGKCVRSRLMSVRDCQAVSKKAIVRRMMERLGVSRLPETGACFPIGVSVVNDRARVTLDMSGEALNRRGYRTWNGEAPLRETLAAAIVDIARYRGRGDFCDPFCGSGTIAIEAALAALNRAPGLNREFAAETWRCLPRGIWQAERNLARSREYTGDYHIFASDIDPRAVAMARDNARRAGVDDCITFAVADAREFAQTTDRGVIVTNPPYGERLMEKREAEALYTAFGAAYAKTEHWRLYLLSSHTEFERAFGRPADKKRKLYNGTLRCDLFQYTKDA